MKKTSLFVATALISVACGTAGFAAELPSYEAAGLPISAVQLRLLGAANVGEQAPAPSSTLTPLQLSVLTPRPQVTTATAEPAPAETTGSIR